MCWELPGNSVPREGLLAVAGTARHAVHGAVSQPVFCQMPHGQTEAPSDSPEPLSAALKLSGPSAPGLWEDDTHCQRWPQDLLSSRDTQTGDTFPVVPGP